MVGAFGNILHDFFDRIISLTEKKSVWGKICCDVAKNVLQDCSKVCWKLLQYSFTKQMKPAIRLPQTYCNLGVKHLDVLREKWLYKAYKYAHAVPQEYWWSKIRSPQHTRYLQIHPKISAQLFCTFDRYLSI